MFIGKINSGPLPHFGGHKQLLKLVDTDFYTGKTIKRCRRSTEHIQPRSHGGSDSLSNFAMVDRDLNHERGNLPLRVWLRIHPEFIDNIQKYVQKYWNLIIDGKKYGQELFKTLHKDRTYI